MTPNPAPQTYEHLLQRAIELITQGQLESVSFTEYVAQSPIADVDYPGFHRLAVALVRGGWHDIAGSPLAETDITTSRMDVGVLAFYQLFGETLLIQLEALSRLIPNDSTL